MTWVIGRAGPFGYSIGLSDIRVTLSDNTEVDCLQKIHRLGPNAVLGFAGSVAIGFAIVESLSTALQTTEENVGLNPQVLAKIIHEGAQDIFNSFSQAVKAGNCHLLLLTAHPQENDGDAPWARCYIHRFYAPDFQPIENRRSEIVSIGSGSNVSQYIDVLRRLENDFDIFKLETLTHYGSAFGLMTSITNEINKTHVKGISDHLHICLVGRDGVKLGMNDITSQDYPEDNFLMPRVAQNWNELEEILWSKGMANSTIELARC